MASGDAAAASPAIEPYTDVTPVAACSIARRPTGDPFTCPHCDGEIIGVLVIAELTQPATFARAADGAYEVAEWHAWDETGLEPDDVLADGHTVLVCIDGHNFTHEDFA